MFTVKTETIWDQENPDKAETSIDIQYDQKNMDLTLAQAMNSMTAIVAFLKNKTAFEIDEILDEVRREVMEIEGDEWRISDKPEAEDNNGIS